MSLRTDLVTYLQEVVAATPGLEDVKVVPSVRQVGELDRPHLIVKTDSYTKVPAAPLRKLGASFVLALVSPHRDIDRAEDDLETRLELLVPALFNHGMSWEDATQTGFGDSYLAFDIRVNSIYKRSS